MSALTLFSIDALFTLPVSLYNLVLRFAPHTPAIKTTIDYSIGRSMAVFPPV
jgi:hypothetical protein